MQGGAFKCKGKKKTLGMLSIQDTKAHPISYELYYCFPMLNPMDFNRKKKFYLIDRASSTCWT